MPKMDSDGTFAVNTQFSQIKPMPNDYKQFYNDTIKRLVEELYQVDITK